MKKIFNARAPLRLGLAGGGTDLSAYCDIYGGHVLNATISKFAYGSIKYLNNEKIRFKANDLNISEEFELNERIDLGTCLKIHKAVYLYLNLIIMKDYLLR